MLEAAASSPLRGQPAPEPSDDAELLLPPEERKTRRKEMVAVPVLIMVALPPAETTKVEPVAAPPPPPASAPLTAVEAATSLQAPAQAMALSDSKEVFKGRIMPHQQEMNPTYEPQMDHFPEHPSVKKSPALARNRELALAPVASQVSSEHARGEAVVAMRRPEHEELPRGSTRSGGQEIHTPPVARQHAESTPETTVQEPARSKEPAAAREIEEPRKIETPKSREISLQLRSPQNERVEVRLAERMGELRVSVRTADPHLRSGLQDNLSELAQRLDAGGYRTELWPSAEAGFSSSHDSAKHGGGDSDRSHSRHGGQQHGGGQGGQQQRHRGDPAQEWSQEMERIL